MKNDKSVNILKNYGKINLKLNKVLDEKNITRNSLATSINSNFSVIDRWYIGDMFELDLDVLARICYVLNCTPNDILEYKK